MKALSLSLFLLFAATAVHSQETLRLGPDFSDTNISDLVSVLVDKTGELTFPEASGLSGRFVPHRSDSFNFGYSSSAYWISGSIAVPLKDPGPWVMETEYPWFYAFDLYLTGPDGKTSRVVQVKKQPFGTRPIQYRSFTLPLELKTGRNTFLIRATGNPLHFRLKVTREKAFYSMARNDYFLLGSYYGVILLIALISLVLYFRVKEIVYVYNILYMVSMGVLQFTLNGLAFQFLWPDALYWHEVSTNFLPGLSLFFGSVLARRFLETRRNMPVMNVLLYVFQAVCAATMAFALLNDLTVSILLINVLMIGMPALFIAMGVIALKRGFYPARYFLLTFAVQAVLLVVYALKDQGVLPNTMLTEYGIQIAILAQVLLLALAMFDRYNLSAQEKERLHREMQVNLEKLVKERTDELVKKQDEVEKDMTQASLVQQSTLGKTELFGQFGFLEADVLYLPMNGKTSGDYYNLQKTESAFGNCLSVLIADATGHGIQAALSTMQIDIINREGLEIQFPHERLSFINRMLVERVTGKNFFTGFLAFIYSDKVVFSGAGHPFQIIVKMRQKEVVRMKPGGKPLGIFGDSDYTMQMESLEPGDVILFYTDGLTEEFDRADEEFGEDKLIDFLKDSFFGGDAPLLKASASVINRSLLKNIETFCKGNRFNDDITSICVRIVEAS